LTGRPERISTPLQLLRLVSDGVIALAVDQVKADGVAYFSSAGNDNSGNYIATFHPISDADARSKFAGNLVLGNVDSDLTAGGFHNFGTAKNVSIALPVFAPPGAHFLVLQWDDAFFANTPTALRSTSQGFMPLDPSQFHFAFNGDADDSVASIVMDASKENIVFGDQTDQFLIGDTNIPQADIVYVNNSGLSPVAKLEFLNKTFKSGRFVDLGFDFDNPLLGFEGINAGLLYGTRVTATIQSGSSMSVINGVLGGPTGRGYAVNDGFGLIDAFAAYLKLTGGAVSAE
jgi:hypothetical protein